MKRLIITNAARAFAVVEKLFELFPSESGFEPYTFVAFAYRADEEREILRRSFRYELAGCWTHLCIEAPRTSSSRRHLLRNLARAGYAPWFALEDSADMRRWLPTAADRHRELTFLEELGATGEPTRWPRRSPTAQPPEITLGQRPRSQWARVIDETRAARVGWDDVTIGFTRSTASPTSGDRSVRITVSVLSMWHEREGKTLRVFANVSDASDARGKRTPLPARIRTLFRRVLRNAGFEPDRARVGKALVRDRVGFDQKFTNEVAAVRACTRIYEDLVGVPIR